jgi:hypothetical protein
MVGASLGSIVIKLYLKFGFKTVLYETRGIRCLAPYRKFQSYKNKEFIFLFFVCVHFIFFLTITSLFDEHVTKSPVLLLYPNASIGSNDFATDSNSKSVEKS